MPYTEIKYDNVKRIISQFHRRNWSWDDILWASQAELSETTRDNMLRMWQDAGMVPGDLTANDWCNLVEIVREQIENAIDSAYIPRNGRPQMQPLDNNPLSCWNQYAAKLRQKGISQEVVAQLEQSCQNIVQGYLANGDNPNECNSTRGMVIGNVQSGKTMHMAGVIAQAADQGFNFFIVLTGIIDNLRKQTEKRLIDDLNPQPGTEGNIVFHPITNPRANNPPYQTVFFSPNQGGYPNNNRYISVTLKNSRRLYNLLRWLYNTARNYHLANMKILIIDDECDQAGVNTADLSQEEATAINSMLCALFFRRSISRDGNQYHFADLGAGVVKAINYLAYSATPYGNLLNDASENSLYPFDYIHALPPSAAYWGPEQFFKIPDWLDQDADDFNDFDYLPFVNEIVDLADAQNFNRRQTNILPESLRTAIHWFLCASAVRRWQGIIKPVSMLVHTSNAVETHGHTGRYILEYLNGLNPAEIRQQLEDCYTDQKQKLSLNNFMDRFEDYEFLDDVRDYPDFDTIFPVIEDILNAGATHLLLDENQEIQYGRGVHVCIDNCRQNGIFQQDDGQDFQMRVAYPEDEQLANLSFAPLFLVVGGNTLSRGLTLEGLVCSYFLRTAGTADSLMQMGRWFGYRKGYELLPRLWITEDTLAKFQGLQGIDELLRSDLQRAENSGLTPREFTVTIHSINVPGMNITAANKRQMAIPAGYDLSGRSIQFSTMDIRENTLRQNHEFVIRFIQSFGGQWQPQRAVGKSFFVEGVNWQRIKAFFDGFERNHNGDKKYLALSNYITQRRLDQRQWTVIIPGVQQNSNGELSIPDTPIQNLGIASRRISRISEDNWISFKVITSPEDMLADIDPGNDFDPPREWVQGESVVSYRYQATRSERNKTPLLLIKPLIPKREDGQVVYLPETLWGYFVFCPSDDGLTAQNIIRGWTVGNMGNEEASEV